jgi:SpoVK/Ycf46/Vps4 family AAA+-type ATPase
MYKAGRLLVADAPDGTAARRQARVQLPTYKGLLESLAEACNGFTGASLAGVVRAAASHALERVVEAAARQEGRILDCVVTVEDLESAVADVRESFGDSDWAEEQ